MFYILLELEEGDLFESILCNQRYICLALKKQRHPAASRQLPSSTDRILTGLRMPLDQSARSGRSSSARLDPGQELSATTYPILRETGATDVCPREGAEPAQRCGFPLDRVSTVDTGAVRSTAAVRVGS